jgi:hypothetical protein
MFHEEKTQSNTMGEHRPITTVPLTFEPLSFPVRGIWYLEKQQLFRRSSFESQRELFGFQVDDIYQRNVFQKSCAK